MKRIAVVMVVLFVLGVLCAWASMIRIDAATVEGRLNVTIFSETGTVIYTSSTCIDPAGCIQYPTPAQDGG